MIVEELLFSIVLMLSKVGIIITVDPATGYKRPTIVNMSWGYGTYSYNVTSINYRGATHSGWTGTGRNTTYGIVGSYRTKYTDIEWVHVLQVLILIYKK